MEIGTSIWGTFKVRPTSAPKLLIYSFIASNILRPTKISITPSPYFRYLKYLATAAKAKYRARSPRMAKMLEVSTMNGSRLTLNTAGMLSMAKATSVGHTPSVLYNEEVIAMHAVGHGIDFAKPAHYDVLRGV